MFTYLHVHCIHVFFSPDPLLLEMVVEDLTVRVENMEDTLLRIEQNQLLIFEKFKQFEEHQRLNSHTLQQQN